MPNSNQNHIEVLEQRLQKNGKTAIYSFETDGSCTVCEVLVSDTDIKVDRRGPNKNIVKQMAAKALLEKWENESNKNDSDSPATNKNGVTNDSLSNKRRELWIKSLGQLPTDDADYVKHLKLFAQKLSTGLPQYKIKKRVIKLREPEEVTVTCTWNNFIFDGVGSTKAEAEKESARVMLNMVRKLCKMKEIPKTKKKILYLKPRLKCLKKTL